MLAAASLAPTALAAAPAARAFAHVYCRWLRDGRNEPGCDLTPFLSPPPGAKFERAAARAIAPGELVTIGWRRAPSP
jgi:hypothetical protein